MTSRSKKYNYNISASGNFVTNNLNLGVSNMFSGSFSASNNVSSATNVTGLSFDKIGKKLGVSDTTIYKWIKNLRAVLVRFWIFTIKMCARKKKLLTF